MGLGIRARILHPAVVTFVVIAGLLLSAYYIALFMSNSRARQQAEWEQITEFDRRQLRRLLDIFAITSVNEHDFVMSPITNHASLRHMRAGSYFAVLDVLDTEWRSPRFGASEAPESERRNLLRLKQMVLKESGMKDWWVWPGYKDWYHLTDGRVAFLLNTSLRINDTASTDSIRSWDYTRAVRPVRPVRIKMARAEEIAKSEYNRKLRAVLVPPTNKLIARDIHDVALLPHAYDREGAHASQADHLNAGKVFEVVDVSVGRTESIVIDMVEARVWP